MAVPTDREAELGRAGRALPKGECRTQELHVRAASLRATVGEFRAGPAGASVVRLRMCHCMGVITAGAAKSYDSTFSASLSSNCSVTVPFHWASFGELEARTRPAAHRSALQPSVRTRLAVCRTN